MLLDDLPIKYNDLFRKITKTFCLSIELLILLLRQIRKTDSFSLLTRANGSSFSIEYDDDDVCGQCLESYSFSLIEFVTYLTQ
jgi:hypothetical protein